MRRVRNLAVLASLLASIGASADFRKPVPPAPRVTTVVPPDWQERTSRLGTSTTGWRAIRQFVMTQPADADDCRLACERSLLCESWTMTRTPGRAPRSDTCVLQAITMPARRDACCSSGLRSSPRPAVPEAVTGPGETFVANSRYARSAFEMVYLRRDATPWQCRAACIEQGQHAKGSACSYWTFAPPGRDPGGSDRFARCFYSIGGSRLTRAAGWAVGGPVPR